MKPARRLIAALVCLAVFDQFVPGLQRRLERVRYEGAHAFRFESSDLFALGPLVGYLREHPRGDRPRTLFLGNSIMFGYGLDAADAVPARYQERHPETQVFNAAVNGFELGSNYLVAKAVIDSVDRLYVMRGTGAVQPMLATLIPVEASDRAAFRFAPPDAAEAALQPMAGIWRLYASTYRIQAALFGTSTRQYLHLRGAAVRRALGLAPPSTPVQARSQVNEPIQVIRGRSATPPDASRRAELQRQDDVLWRFGELVSAHRKRAVVLQIGAVAGGAAVGPEVADFNAAFAPFV